jgi:mono/diheme cytochrome c family protein
LKGAAFEAPLKSGPAKSPCPERNEMLNTVSSPKGTSREKQLKTMTMMMMRCAMATMFAVLASGCGPMTREEKISALSGTASAGASLYSANCSSCHGVDGKGAATFPSLVEPVKNDPKAEVVGVILNGKTGTSMMSYATLTDQQVADLYAYLKETVGK